LSTPPLLTMAEMKRCFGLLVSLRTRKAPPISLPSGFLALSSSIVCHRSKSEGWAWRMTVSYYAVELTTHLFDFNTATTVHNARHTERPQLATSLLSHPSRTTTSRRRFLPTVRLGGLHQRTIYLCSSISQRFSTRCLYPLATAVGHSHVLTAHRTPPYHRRSRPPLKTAIRREGVHGVK
jgi:hypothetical protein